MKNIIFLLCAAFVFCSFSAAFAETKKPNYPGSVHQLVLDQKKENTYAKLAKNIGFELNKKYSYSEYVDIKRINNVGIAGQYDYLLLSTGGSEWDYAAWEKYIKQKCGWEMTFYQNHNLTVVHEVCHDDTRTRSWVRILKVASGRQPNLHQD